MGLFGASLILKPTAEPIIGLVAEYLANNNFLDTSGNGYNGVNNNVTFGSDRHSNPNSAFVLNGTNAFININAALAGLSTTTQGTWSAWIKPVDGTAISEIIMSFGDINGAERIFFANALGKFQNAATLGSNKWILSTSNIVFSDDTWAHVALVQNGTSPVLYIDGVAVAQNFSVSTDKTTWFNDLTGLDNGRIGNLNWNNGGEINHFEGSIDDIKIYNRALSQSEITALANE